jgi:hypothetical protein
MRLTRAQPPALAAHRRWHYTRGEPPTRYIKWFVRSAGAPPSETAANLWRSLAAWVTGTETPWAAEAREAAEEAAAGGEETEGEKGETDGAEDEKAGSHKSRSTTSSVRSAKALSSYKRQIVFIGVFATLICWAIFVWFIFVRTRSGLRITPC